MKKESDSGLKKEQDSKHKSGLMKDPVAAEVKATDTGDDVESSGDSSMPASSSLTVKVKKVSSTGTMHTSSSFEKINESEASFSHETFSSSSPSQSPSSSSSSTGGIVQRKSYLQVLSHFGRNLGPTTTPTRSKKEDVPWTSVARERATSKDDIDVSALHEMGRRELSS